MEIAALTPVTGAYHLPSREAYGTVIVIDVPLSKAIPVISTLCPCLLICKLAWLDIVVELIAKLWKINQLYLFVAERNFNG